MSLSLKQYRNAAVPLLAVETADPAGVLKLAVTEATNGKVSPVFVWNVIRGIEPANKPAEPIANQLNQNQEPAIATGNPVEALRAIEKLGGDRDERSVVVMIGLADILADPQTATPTKQALWNLRDVLPSSGAIVVMTVPFGWRNPFPNDIAVTIDPLPNAEELRSIVSSLCGEAKVTKPSEEILGRSADALLGVSRFAAQQAVALSLSPKGVNVDTLWERKRNQVAQTPGLTIYSGREKFDDLGGVEQAKRLFRKLALGKRRPGAIVYIDEIEKGLAGSGGGDLSGTSQSHLGYLLSYMQDQAATGAIFYGHPGAAKSALAKAIGNEAECPTVQLDLGALKGGIVGESESRMREALAVITAISGGRPMFIATCNGIATLPPELRRRFTLGTIFFDLPTEAERAKIWPIYLRKFALDAKQELPASDGWTGADIQQCSDMADRLGVSLVEAATYVVPGWISARESIEKRRLEAAGRYLSAGEDGIYRTPDVRPTGASRRMEMK